MRALLSTPLASVSIQSIRTCERIPIVCLFLKGLFCEPPPLSRNPVTLPKLFIFPAVPDGKGASNIEGGECPALLFSVPDCPALFWTEDAPNGLEQKVFLHRY
ncbi:hypothetical protein CDAR_417091 [Caerostris darwini]|uniref:Uncharacterized protein n=1 Tax=Caerostris darwini TaxID=1538125 RepID=A0AAV4X952_9ARAC|nr:hypothetical protein CDAR_417091 [Caerostris darwini]